MELEKCTYMRWSDDDDGGKDEEENNRDKNVCIETGRLNGNGRFNVVNCVCDGIMYVRRLIA